MGIAYSSLLEKDEIRLLRIEPGIGDAQVKCSLFHARLGESPTYDALSYMWGLDNNCPGNSKTTLIAIDGARTMEVQENLGNALKTLRLKDKARVLWVDAICMNQADPIEKKHQVAQMGLIYSQATTVRVWLGNMDEPSAKAFRFLENPGTIRRLKEGIIELDGWEAVAGLCKRHYWERLWIIQEVVLAARIDIHCGKRVLPWERFSTALFALEEGLQHFACVLTPFRAGAIIAKVVDSAAMKICRQRRAHVESGPVTELPSLMSLLWIHKDAKCADVRDKVFGIHSFAPVCCRSCVPVDYSYSAYTLCRKLLEHDIQFHSEGRRNGGRDMLVRRSLNLHGLLVQGALNQIHSKNSFPVGGPELVELQEGMPSSQTPSPILVLGNEIGRVAFITPPLKSLFVESGSLMVPHAMIEAFQQMKFGFEESETPALTTRITRALRQIWRNNELDIFLRPGDRNSQNLEMVDLHRPEVQDYPVIHSLQTFMEFCSEYLRTSEFLGVNPQYVDCVMYLARGGIEDGFRWKVGFAPVGTELGDSVCTFKDTNIIAIVRNIHGDHIMVGQGASLALPQSKSAPQTGNVLNIQFDLSKLQMFSVIHYSSDIPDYRIALLMPPSSSGRRGLPSIGRDPPEMSKASDPNRQRVLTTASRDETRPKQLGKGIDLEASSSEASNAQRSKGKHPARTYSCLRCRATFDTSRDNLVHAATWSHQQCNKCQRWKSWESTTSTTSTTPICAQCRLEDTGSAVDMPSHPKEVARISWQSDTTSELEWVEGGAEDSINGQSEDISSNATVLSDVETECSDETYENIRGIWSSYMLAKDGPFYR
ncbi:hypothetical protein L207DRAFT_511468 [Hyaloscypha variabilis F]|uniref:C2H2-type domain-containing protein n=1 Tax=Hyaloscypha variabilis (strain UAMH 11265 / GT02V1 / F) TaxID=1149755 RepID=A0A2J6RT07_HYAVF|nr:hypothetical protein L207DRAFT_511468 [Hyaloscypha variabilis F]